ncbi:hypothetical protein TNCT_661621 [Trichonephila clavata]|uniref:Uncharacterized protein n=1 Tax=Trichonephila clavata TaxID=2740835 RepID=A0A8X6LBZ8_TRICU|nr:hypothetical protein TNCT_661621 [Trichonephila clavata]
MILFPNVGLSCMGVAMNLRHDGPHDKDGGTPSFPLVVLSDSRKQWVLWKGKRSEDDEWGRFGKITLLFIEKRSLQEWGLVKRGLWIVGSFNETECLQYNWGNGVEPLHYVVGGHGSKKMKMSFSWMGLLETLFNT